MPQTIGQISPNKHLFNLLVYEIETVQLITQTYLFIQFHLLFYRILKLETFIVDHVFRFQFPIAVKNFLKNIFFQF